MVERSSARRARRWVVQELIRGLDQLFDAAVRAILSSDGKSNEGGDKSGCGKSS
jgi:hypothetical protein